MRREDLGDYGHVARRCSVGRVSYLSFHLVSILSTTLAKWKSKRSDDVK